MMTVFERRYARGVCVQQMQAEQPIFQFRPSVRAVMTQRRGTERAILEIWSTILRNPCRCDVNNVEEESRTQANILSKITQKLELISLTSGRETYNTLLKKIFENKAVVKKMQQNVGISQSRRFLVNETELQIVRDVFEKRTGQLGQSFFTYYTRDLWKGLKRSSVSSN